MPDQPDLREQMAQALHAYHEGGHTPACYHCTKQADLLAGIVQDAIDREVRAAVGKVCQRCGGRGRVENNVEDGTWTFRVSLPCPDGVRFRCPVHGHMEAPLSAVTLVLSDPTRVYVTLPCRKCPAYWEKTLDAETVEMLLDAGVPQERALDAEPSELTGGTP